MKFSTKGPKEKEKKEKRKSTANKGVMIEEFGGCGHGGWLSKDDHCQY